LALARLGQLLLELVGVALGGALDALAGRELALETRAGELELVHALALRDQPGGGARVEARPRIVRARGRSIHAIASGVRIAEAKSSSRANRRGNRGEKPSTTFGAGTGYGSSATRVR